MKTYTINTEINFTKNGHETNATVCARYINGELRLLACTASQSKWFKNMKAAIKWMNSYGYEAA